MKTYAQNIHDDSQNADQGHQLKGMQKFQEDFGYFQMAWPVVKWIQNGVESAFVQRNPQCMGSQALELIGTGSYASLALRLGNMVSNILMELTVLDDMEKAVESTLNDDGTVNEKGASTTRFYEIMVREYRVAANYAMLDFSANVIDMALSATEMIVILYEVAKFYATGGGSAAQDACVPTPI